MVRPSLDRLLVYVDGPFPGFARDRTAAFHAAPGADVEAYVAANIAALRATFRRWPPDCVIASHAMPQPYAVGQALSGSAPYVATVHGSELNFSVKQEPSLVPLALSGLAGAAAVITVSQASGQDVAEWAEALGLDLRDKLHPLPPGVDGTTFTPAPGGRTEALAALARDVPFPNGFDLRDEGPILAFAGRLMWTKGIQHVAAALPLIAAARPGVRLLVAGEGPAREPVERLLAALGAGDLAAARRLAATEPELGTLPQFGPVVPDDLPAVPGLEVAFLGHLRSTQLARVFAAADVSLAPSVFPESFGLVTIEALSCGALPVAGYHSGLTAVLDAVAGGLSDRALQRLGPPTDLTAGVAESVLDLLSRYPTNDPAFRSRLHDLAGDRFPSWQTVARRYLELAGGTAVAGG